MKTLLLITTALLLAACSVPQRPWGKADSTFTPAAVLEKDQRECEYEGIKAAVPFVEFRRAITQMEVTEACMKSRGYSQ